MNLFTALLLITFPQIGTSGTATSDEFMDTCLEWKTAGPTRKEMFITGMREGYLSGQFVLQTLIMRHELAGKNTEHFTKVLNAIEEEMYKKFKVADIVDGVNKFCALDERGAIQLFLIYPTIVRRMSGGSMEEFLQSVRAIMVVHYGKSDMEI